MKNGIEQIDTCLASLVSQIEGHPLYHSISSIDALQFFMENHVFAVWDFMCLIKELYQRIVCTTSPWFPAKDPMSANLISSILADEEGDIDEDGETYISHFDLYIKAMNKVGADTLPITRFISQLKSGSSVEDALNNSNASVAAKKFVLNTFSFFKGKTHEIASAFTYGREAVTPIIFGPLVHNISHKIPEKHKTSTLIYYLHRHIELDGDEHFSKSSTMLKNLIENDPTKIDEAKAAAVKALEARLDFLNDLYQLLEKKCNINKTEQTA